MMELLIRKGLSNATHFGGESNFTQMYGDFEGFAIIIVHCLGWCQIMTPGLLLYIFLG